MPTVPEISFAFGLTSGLLTLGILFFIYLLIEAFSLCVAGEIVVGRRVTYGESIRIAFFGTIAVAASIILLGQFGLLISIGTAAILFLPIMNGSYHPVCLRAI